MVYVRSRNDFGNRSVLRYNTLPSERFSGKAIDMTRLVFGIVVTSSGNLTAPSLVGFISLFVLVIVIVYLQDMKVNIPITSHRMPGVKSGMPLNSST